jgi:phosphoglycerate dehydrogenase-like enzyme
MPQLLLTTSAGNIGPHLEILKKNGFDVKFLKKSDNPLNEDELIELLQDCEASLAGIELYTPRVFESCPNLRVVSRYGVGFDTVNVEAATKNNVVVTTTPGVNHHAVAEQAIAMILYLGRGLYDQDRRVREKNWERIATPRIMNSTLGLIGLGRIGQAVATRARGLGMKVISFEPYPDQEFIKQWEIELTSLDDLYSKSDYISLHCPMIPENHHLINQNSISKMKTGAILVNTARGPLVDEKSLYEALKTKKIRAAGLDVFETEPLPVDDPLQSLDNTVFAGHVAGLDDESHHDTLTMIANTVIDLYNGGWPEHCIQNQGLDNWKWDK